MDGKLKYLFFFLVSIGATGKQVIKILKDVKKVARKIYRTRFAVKDLFT